MKVKTLFYIFFIAIFLISLSAILIVVFSGIQKNKEFEKQQKIYEDYYQNGTYDPYYYDYSSRDNPKCPEILNDKEMGSKVAKFDGVNDYMTFSTTGFSTGSQSATMSVWVYEENLTTNRYYVLGYGACSDNREFRISLNEFSPGQFSLETYGSGWHSNATLSANTWYHLAVTYNGKGNPLFYVNGVLQGSGGTWGSPEVNTASNGGAMGIRGNCGAGYSINGSIDDASIWSRALSNNEILKLYKKEIKSESISDNKLSVHFDDSSTESFKDSSGKGNEAHCLAK